MNKDNNLRMLENTNQGIFKFLDSNKFMLPDMLLINLNLTKTMFYLE